MKVKHIIKTDSAYPAVLQSISSPPKELFILGDQLTDFLARPRVAIVGSRAVTTYGRSITMQLARELAERGVVIVSGLALGVDALAHQAALDAGGDTIAVLGGGLDEITPVSNRQLAERLLLASGVIVSEYPVGTPTFKQNFVARNRLVSGLSTAVLVTEAAAKSGSLHTARFALEQGRDVLAVPGNITSPQSVGTNNLIRTGATPVTSVNDILHVLGLKNVPAGRKRRGETTEEQLVIDLLYKGVSDGHELLQASKLVPETFTQVLTMLEIAGTIRPLGNNHWAVK